MYLVHQSYIATSHLYMYFSILYRYLSPFLLFSPTVSPSSLFPRIPIPILGALFSWRPPLLLGRSPGGNFLLHLVFVLAKQCILGRWKVHHVQGRDRCWGQYPGVLQGWGYTGVEVLRYWHSISRT